MHDELVGGQGQAVDAAGGVTDAQLVARGLIPLEKARVAPRIGGQPLPTGHAPVDLHRRKPLAQGIEQIADQVAEGRVADQLAHRVGQLHGAGLVAGRFHHGGQPGHGHAAGAQHAAVVPVPLLDLLGQGQVVVMVALGGALQQTGQALGREPAGHRLGPHLAHAGELGGGMFLAQRGQRDRAAVSVEQAGILRHRGTPEVWPLGRGRGSGMP